MKILIAAALIFILLLGFGITAGYYIDNTAASLMNGTSAVEQSIQVRKWSEAKEEFSRLNTSWNKISPKWMVLIDHQELDNINMTMARAEEFMKTRYVPGAMSELAQLKLLFKHIPENESVNLKNIL